MPRPALPSRSSLAAAVRRPALPLVVGLLLAALVAGLVGWSVTGKTVLLSVDGSTREVDFRGQTVEDVLEAAGQDVGERDLLVPAAGAEVGDGDRVALRRARELTLVVDGKEQQVWVTATSVEEALDQVGLREGGLALSASRSRELPLDGFRLEVTTPKDVVVVADGKQRRLSSTATTVKALLTSAGIAVGPRDRLSKPAAAAPADGDRLQVVRVRTQRVTERDEVAFETERREDADLLKGETTTVRAGKAGVLERVVEVITADGKQEKRTVVSSRTVTAPVDRVVAVGTKPRPAPAPEPAAPAAPQESSASRSATGGADSLNWPALADCESGGNPRAVSGSGKYRGLYQFSLETWRGVGGSGDPIDNSSGEQTYRAKLLYNRSGAGQWPSCGSRLFS